MQSNYQPKARTELSEDKCKKIVSNEVTAEDKKDEPVVINTSDSEPSTKEKAEKPSTTGVVTDCLKLNIRKTPVEDPTGANIIGTIECLTEVMIDMGESTDKFYKVCTAAGLEGFCMKKYIAVRQQ